MKFFNFGGQKMSSQVFQAEIIRELKQESPREEIQRCYPIMRELRPHLEEHLFADQVLQQMKEGYRLACLEEGNEIRALAGFRILTFLAWGKTLYIDDLITAPKARRRGCGGNLLKWAVNQVRLVNCDQVHLDSGPQRHEAHRLYLNHGMKIIGYHFALDFKQ